MCTPKCSFRWQPKNSLGQTAPKFTWRLCVEQLKASEYIWWGHPAPNLKDIPEPSHGRVLREKFHSVYVVKGV